MSPPTFTSARGLPAGVSVLVTSVEVVSVAFALRLWRAMATLPLTGVVLVLRMVSRVDLETEDRWGLRSVGVFDTGVLRGGVHADAADGEGLSVGTHVEHGVVERVRAVEVHGLRTGRGRRVILAEEVLQSRVAREAERFHSCGLLRSGDAVGELLGHRDSMIRDEVRTGRAERAADEGETRGHFHVARLHLGLTSRGISQLVDAVLVIVGSQWPPFIFWSRQSERNGRMIRSSRGLWQAAF